MGHMRAFSSVRLERSAHNGVVLGSNPRRPIGGKQLADHLKGRDSEAEVAVNGALLYRPQRDQQIGSTANARSSFTPVLRAAVVGLRSHYSPSLNRQDVRVSVSSDIRGGARCTVPPHLASWSRGLVVMTPPLHGGEHRFKSCRLHYGLVAQLG